LKDANARPAPTPFIGGAGLRLAGVACRTGVVR
jgi:hypothetical protein